MWLEFNILGFGMSLGLFISKPHPFDETIYRNLFRCSMYFNCKLLFHKSYMYAYDKFYWETRYFDIGETDRAISFFIGNSEKSKLGFWSGLLKG